MPTGKKKALFVVTKSNFGGAQRYVYDLATSLPDSFDVVVALGGTGKPGSATGALESMLKEKRVHTIYVKNFARDVFILKDIAALFELISIFKTECPHVVHLNSSKAGGLGAVAARLAGIRKIVFTAHGWPFWEKNRNAVWRAFAFGGSFATALLVHRVIVVSNYDRTVGRRMPFVKHKVVRIYNGIAPMSLGSGEVIRNAFPPGAHITGTIGELNANKNQHVLIEEARKKPDMFVAIVGEGEQRALLENKIRKYNLESRVKLFGFLPARDVLKGFDTFALPSLKEGLPYVLIEARAAGIPIVANRTIGGIAEILDAEDMREFSLENMVRQTVDVYNS